MARKRKNGEGTVRLRKDGRWEGRIVIGYDENGLPKTKNVLAKTKGECIEKLKALKNSITPDTPIKLKADMPFGEWLDYWYETYCKPNARPATQRTYEGYIRLYLHPRLGSIPLNKVTTSDIQQMCTWMMTEARVDQKNGDSGLSDSQVINCYSLCDRVLEKAMAEKLIVRNPAKGCKLPPNRPNEMKVLSREDMQKVLIQAKEENYYELFLLEFATGLRLGELMALQWDDVNLVTGELRINKQVNLVGSKLVISEPKTKAAVRTLILPPSVRKVLAEYKTRVNSRWLFPSPKKDDLPIIPSAVSRRLHTLLEHAGCEQVRFHDLRHTFATNALAHGMDIKTLSTILGHVSSATTLNTYSHVTDEMRQRAAVKIDQGIAKAEVQDTAIAQPERTMTTFQARKRWSREAS
ncbi:site-specific integrase [Flavonifractor sp. An100]|uniref:tyrosine-type recombinase/integrase n=1 Tax=Flavonifractor sp. An100 TaxID=1965538 RepID=UPI000B3ABA72|nr:site-specific integrase [Flavonifractor sp. An100]OUQ81003.1 site-specific integrase [Flavonifractor sp. An100]